MARVGVLTFSDGRDFAHRVIEGFLGDAERALVGSLEEAGHEVICAGQPITSSQVATLEARRIEAARPDLVIFHLPVWAFPNFSMLAADTITAPLLLLSSLRPEYPGMVGMLAAAGALDQIGRTYGRAWGSITDPHVWERVERHVRAAHAVTALKGAVFGRFGGRPMGMYTAVANADQWLRQFGVDVEEIDQWEIVRRADQVAVSRARAGREWLERHARAVRYDGRLLTPAILERQVRSYHAVRELIEEWHLDFSGIKAQPELTNNFCTMDVTEAFLNDPYDWEGAKATHVCATEADMDGALTMQILRLLRGLPVLFADLRHYDREGEVWDLCNSGQHATWFAARSADPEVNLRQVELWPESFYFPAGGASVRHIAAPGEMTFARLTRDAGGYRMQAVRGELVRFGEKEDERRAAQSSPEWPHAFARLKSPVDAVLSRYGSNHIHGIAVDCLAELEIVCRYLGVRWENLEPAA